MWSSSCSGHYVKALLPMSTLDEILKLSLPTRLSRWISAGTIALAVTSFGVPEIIVKMGTPIPTRADLLLRIAAATTVLFVGTFVVLVLVLRYLREVKLNPKSAFLQQINLDRGEPLLSILAVIARNYSQEMETTPKAIAAELAIDENVVLAHMRKYHNEQYITYRSGGAEPTIDTPFFLNAKAWKCITVAKA